MRLLLCAILVCAMICGCLRMGQASDDDKAALDAWSKVVSDKDRAEVQRAASFHTDWMEKKKVEWMAQQYKSRYSKQQVKKAATQATTRAATQPGTAPTTIPAP